LPELFVHSPRADGALSGADIPKTVKTGNL